MLNYLVDIARVGQYLRNAERVRALFDAPAADLRFLDQIRRGLVPLPIDRPHPVVDPFEEFHPRKLPALDGRRVAIVATGGSGALASVVGVARVLEEAGVTPAAFGVCSGSALFGIPLAAGMTPAEVAEATLSLTPHDYLDPDWRGLAGAPLRLGRGWSGLLRGQAIEDAYTRILGDITLGELPIPVWFPIWNIETNRVEYIGPDNHPDMPAARAVRMAVSLPLAIQPTEHAGGWWLDGGIVDILPAEPFVVADRCDVAIVVNGFYAPGFEPDHEPSWNEAILSILRVASQTRLMHHIQLTRRSIAALEDAVGEVIELTPVEYSRVHGAGLYGEFVDNRNWAGFMTDGYRAAAAALDGASGTGRRSLAPARARGRMESPTEHRRDT